MTVNKKANPGSILTEALDDSRHEITNDDQITHSDSKALDSDCSIEYDSGVGIGNLGKGKKGGRSPFEISGASCLKVETKACGNASPYDDGNAE